MFKGLGGGGGGFLTCYPARIDDCQRRCPLGMHPNWLHHMQMRGRRRTRQGDGHTHQCADHRNRRGGGGGQCNSMPFGCLRFWPT